MLSLNTINRHVKHIVELTGSLGIEWSENITNQTRPVHFDMIDTRNIGTHCDLQYLWQ